MDAKLLRVEMLEIMGLLDNLQANWPDDAPPIPYIKAFRLRLAKATLRNLCLKENISNGQWLCACRGRRH